MALALYQQAFQDTLSAYPDEFNDFSNIHAKYSQDQDRYKADFDRIGKPILDIISRTENKLCSKMEQSGRGKYSAHLAEKFRQEVKSMFPLIDMVGVTVS